MAPLTRDMKPPELSSGGGLQQAGRSQGALCFLAKSSWNFHKPKQYQNWNFKADEDTYPPLPYRPSRDFP